MFLSIVRRVPAFGVADSIMPSLDESFKPFGPYICLRWPNICKQIVVPPSSIIAQFPVDDVSLQRGSRNVYVFTKLSMSASVISWLQSDASFRNITNRGSIDRSGLRCPPSVQITGWFRLTLDLTIEIVTLCSALPVSNPNSRCFCSMKDLRVLIFSQSNFRAPFLSTDLRNGLQVFQSHLF